MLNLVKRKTSRTVRITLAWALATVMPLLYAGNQQEEALADSVRIALTHAILDQAPPKIEFVQYEQQNRYQQWTEKVSAHLARKIADPQARSEFLETVYYEATRAGLDPTLVLGLIQVESAFRKYAISSAGARGLMQVMPFWTRVIGDHDPAKLFHLQTNLRYGCAILRMYLNMEKGNLYLALGRYNGSRGRPEYPNAVYRSWQNLQRVVETPLQLAQQNP